MGEQLCRDAANLKGANDVPNDSHAWEHCKVKLSGSASGHPNVPTKFQGKDKGAAISFQTTVQACGSIMNAERIARLCYAKVEAGSTKEEVVEFRNGLYTEANPKFQPRKRNRTNT